MSRKHLQSIAIRYRDALLVAMAAFLPLRRSNLAELRIGSTLVCSGPLWSVSIPGDNVKNGEAIHADFPSWISSRIDRFPEVYRPIIYHSTSHDGLWTSAKGQAAGSEALYRAFQKVAAAAIGIQLTLHDTRRPLLSKEPLDLWSDGVPDQFFRTVVKAVVHKADRLLMGTTRYRLMLLADPIFREV